MPLGSPINNVKRGTRKDDILNGTDANDLILGLGGHDSIDGGAGNDNINAGWGNDQVRGGSGRDVISFGFGDDLGIFAMAANSENTGLDRYLGGFGADTLRLEFTKDEWVQDDVQSDIADYLAHLDRYAGKLLEPGYTFSAFKLLAHDFEALEVTVDGVSLNPVDEAVTLMDDTADVAENSSVTIDVLANDDVPDLVKELTLISGVTRGVLTRTADDTFAFEANGDFDYLAEGETTTESFEYQVVDADGDTETASATVTVTGVNDDPTLAAGAASAVEDGPIIQVDLTTLGADVDSDDDGTTLEYTLIGAAAEGTASITGGMLSFDPGVDFQDLGEGQTREITLDVMAKDRHGATASNVVTVTVTGTNDDPVALADANSDDAVIEAGYQEPGDALATGNVIANDTDVDADDSLEVSSAASGSIENSGQAVPAQGGADGAAYVVKGTYGVLTLFIDGSYRYALDDELPVTEALAEGDVGTDIFNYQVSDGHGGVAQAELTIEIQGSNDNVAPVLTASSHQLGESDSVSGTFTAVDPNPGDYISDVEITSPPQKGEVVLGSDQSWQFLTNGDFEHLAAGASETVSLSYRVADSMGALSDIATKSFIINGENDAPELQDSERSVDEGTLQVVIDLASLASDVDDGAVLSYELLGSPDTGSAEITGSQLTLTFDPEDFPGLRESEAVEIPVSVQVKDEHDAKAEATVTVTVNGVNSAPEFLYDRISTVADEEQKTLTIEGYWLNEIVGDSEDYPTDGGYPLPGNDLKNLTFEILDASHKLPIYIGSDNLVHLYAGDRFQYLAEGETETVTATLKVTDQDGASDTLDVELKIQGLDDEPTIGPEQHFTVYEGEAISGITFNGSDIDASDGELTFEVTSGAYDIGTMTQQSDGSYTYSVIGDPEVESFAEGYTETNYFDVVAKQGGRAVGQTGFTVDIIGKNDAPTGKNYSLVMEEDALNPNAGLIPLYDLIDDIDELGATPGSFEIVRGPDLGTVYSSGMYGPAGLVFDPTYDFNHLNYGDEVSTDFTYKYTDDAGAVTTGRIDVTVQGSDDIVGAKDQTYGLAENSGIVGRIQTYDVDGGNYTFYKIDSDKGPYDGQPSEVYDEETYNPNGTFKLNPDGSFLYVSAPLGDVPDAGTTETFDVIVADSHGYLNGPRVTLTFNTGGANNDVVASALFASLSEDARDFKTPFQVPHGSDPADFTFTSDWNLRDSSGKIVAQANLTADNQLGISSLDNLQYLDNDEYEVLTLDYTMTGSDPADVYENTAYITVAGKTDPLVENTAILRFHDENQSIFGAGDALTESITPLEFGPDIDESDTFTIVPGVAELRYDLDLMAQLKAFLGATSGKIDSDLSLEVTFTTPYQVKAGDAAVIGSSYQLMADQSSTEVTGPDIAFDLDLMLEFGVDIDLLLNSIDGWQSHDLITVSPAVTTVTTEDHPIYGDGIERGLNLLSKSASDTSFDFSIPGLSEYFKLTASAPNLSATGSYDSGSDAITSQSRGEFFSATIDVDNIATDLLGTVLPPLKPAMELLNPYIDLGVAQFSASIFDLDMVPALSLVQDIKVAATGLIYDLYIDGQTEAVVEDYSVGDEFVFNVPEDADDLMFTAVCDLEASMTNMMSMGFDTSFVFSLLSMTTKLPLIPEISLGPVFTETLDTPGVTLPPFVDDTFAMDFSNTESIDFYLNVA